MSEAGDKTQQALEQAIAAPSPIDVKLDHIIALLEALILRIERVVDGCSDAGHPAT
jgi:hypothetical protein